MRSMCVCVSGYVCVCASVFMSVCVVCVLYICEKCVRISAHYCRFECFKNEKISTHLYLRVYNYMCVCMKAEMCVFV